MSAVMFRETRLGVRAPVHKDPTPSVRAQTTVRGASKFKGRARSILLFESALHNSRRSMVGAHCVKRILVEKLITDVKTYRCAKANTLVNKLRLAWTDDRWVDTKS